MSPSRQHEVSYFGAGPAKLPAEVLQEARNDILNWQDTGVGILEASHRSTEFTNLIEEAELRLRRMVGISEDYAVLFMQGGGTLQFAAVVCNLLSKEATAVDYLITGTWSSKAAEEARKLLSRQGNVIVNEISLFSEHGGERQLTPPNEWNLDQSSSFVYYCDNETVDGVEMPSSSYIPDLLAARGLKVPIVCDMSSNFLSRPIDVSKFGIIFATAQKNFGPAGITVVIVLKDLLRVDRESLLLPLPTMLDYQVFATNKSLYNTPPCFAISVCNQVFNWLEKTFHGDLDQLARHSVHKSVLLYNCISESDGYYRCIAPNGFRSRMNIVFRICSDDGRVNKDLEDRFVKDATAEGLLQVRGHRSVGGIRVSLYNAVNMDDTHKMLSFMRFFSNAVGIEA